MNHSMAEAEYPFYWSHLPDSTQGLKMRKGVGLVKSIRFNIEVTCLETEI